MTSPFLAHDISADEGFREEAYPDPLTGREPWTCGFGCTGPDVGPESVWTLAEAETRRDARIADALNSCRARLPWFPHINAARQDVVVNMVYNLGWPRFVGFHHMILAAASGDFDAAADEMLDSRWARQLPNRAGRLAQQMRSGHRQPPSGSPA